MSERRAREVWAHNGTTWVKEDEISILEAKLDAMEKRCIMEVELRIEQVTALEARLAAAQQLVNTQAEDEGLWFFATRVPEAYLQQELRRLHAVIEAAAQEEQGA